MKNISDDLLNKYLDNELSKDEKTIVLTEIEKSPDLKKRYQALLKAHLILKEIKSETTSVDFTNLVMQKIAKHKSMELQQKRFLFVVLSIFGVIMLGIVGYVFYQFIISIRLTESNEVVSTYSRILGDFFISFFGEKNLSILGSILSFIMLVSGYFLYEHQKNSKKNFSH